MKRAEYSLYLDIKQMAFVFWNRSVKSLVLFTLLIPILSIAQYQGNNWILNDSIGIKFLPDNSVQFFTPNMSGVYRHSTASISALSGDLLYYSGTKGNLKYPDISASNETYFYNKNLNL